MKVLLIYPGLNEVEHQALIIFRRFRVQSPFLGLPYIAAVTPSHIDVEIIDEANGRMHDYKDADIVGITGMTLHANRMYEIADNYRSKGIPVVLGGIHVSFNPEEARNHADSIVIGEGEELWPILLKDFESNSLKPVYRQTQLIDINKLPYPRVDLCDGIAYRLPKGNLNAMMITRGCPHDCIYCCITQMFGRKFRTRNIDDVIKEISNLKYKYVFFHDDNLIGNPKYAKDLFFRLMPMKLDWSSQCSIKIAEYPELLDLAARSGCSSLYIGFETIDFNNMTFINKNPVNSIEKFSDNIKKIHDRGIGIYASFMVGLENDDESVFENINKFMEINKIEYPAVNIFTPYPGTRLFEMYNNQNRIIDTNWDRYDFFHVVFKPSKMTPEQLDTGFKNFMNKTMRDQYRRIMIRSSH